MDKTLRSRLTQYRRYDGREFVIVRPGIVASYYVATNAPEAAKAIGAAIRRYIDFVGAAALPGHLAQNGTIKTLTQARIERDLRIFDSVKPKDPAPDLDYTGAADGSVGEFGLTVVGTENNDKLWPLSTSLLRLEFPDDALERFGTEELLKFLFKEGEHLGAQCGSVGWGFKRAVPFESEAGAAVTAMLPRYLGFDACYNGFSSKMRGRTPPASWIIYVNDSLYEACGGRKRFREVAPKVVEQAGKKLTALRATEVPPIGDANRRASDVGALPDLARFLKPTRVTIGGLGAEGVDATAWLARFDDMPAKDWKNA